MKHPRQPSPFTDKSPSDPMEEDDQLNSGVEPDLPSSFRTARRNVIIASALSLAWSCTQFKADPIISIAGISFNFGDTAIPAFLALTLIYLGYQWFIEFAIMPLSVRRWNVAQLDFKVTFLIARLSLLSIAAGALQRSLQAVLLTFAGLLATMALSCLVSVILAFIITPIRLAIRARTNRTSVASAAIEGFFWARLITIYTTIIAVIGFGVAIYTLPSFKMLFSVPPHPVPLTLFIITVIAFLLSIWTSPAITHYLFSKKQEDQTKDSQPSQ